MTLSTRMSTFSVSSMVTFNVSNTTCSTKPKPIHYQSFLDKHKVVTENKGNVRFATTPENPVKTSIANGFVGAAFDAYSNHHHLVLRPDDVWLAVATAFGTYVNAHAEEMRYLFVNHEGKKQLSVNVDFEDWNVIINLFKDKLPEKVREWLVPNFSTTTEKDVLVGSSILMATMKNYYSYSVHIQCGLPSVTMEGTLEDWLLLKSKVDGILEYSEDHPLLKKWHDRLVPIIDEFVKSYSGEVNVKFWNQICNYISGGSGPSYISGWINMFIPFDEKGRWILNTRGPYFFKDEHRAEYPYHFINTGNVPSGCCEVPIKVDDNGREFDALLYAGSLVSSYNYETNEIKPSYDAFVIEIGK